MHSNRIVMRLGNFTFLAYLTIHFIYLQAFLEDPNGIKSHMAGLNYNLAQVLGPARRVRVRDTVSVINLTYLDPPPLR